MKERKNISDFTGEIHHLFGLKKQARELVTWVTKATGCRHAGLLFLNIDGGDFTSLSLLPKSKANPFRSLRLGQYNPIVKYLRREKKLLTRESLATMPDFRRLQEQGSLKTDLGMIELIVPMISRNRLIGILILGEKDADKYSPDDYNLLQSVTDEVAVSMEKEYLREQLSQRKKELTVINRCITIMASSLDIQRIFDNVINESRRIVEIAWAAIALITDKDLCLLVFSSEAGSTFKVGGRISISGTATEWVANHKNTIIESDLVDNSLFNKKKPQLMQGVRSITYLPLITKGEVIGSLIVASRKLNVYTRRQIDFLEVLASQITVRIEHSQLFTKLEEQARFDIITGLLNRRSFDEIITSDISRYYRYGGIFSLILADVDSLKTVNDTYGHLAGDEVLRQIGGIIRKVIRASDQAFRYGGDEFAILLPNTSVDAAKRVAERFRKQISSMMTTTQTPVTASFGLASWPANGREANEIIAAADDALYHAKQSGRNQSY